MDKFYLEEPTIGRKREALDFLEEFVRFGSEINGTGCLHNCLEGLKYEEFLVETEKRKDKDYAYSINRCPSKTFFFVRDSDNKIIGMINIRYEVTAAQLASGASHIGYSIRPTERRKGYNKIQLYLGLVEQQKIGGKRVLLDCTVDNIGSNKTIVALGGELEKTALDPSDNTMTNYYWIDVDKSVEVYKNVYGNLILSNQYKSK